MKNTGTFFLVVGPSGAGKDALMDGARAALATEPRYVFARRTITRPAGSPGEVHDGASEAEFIEQERAGAFLVTWQAHGLRYGLPRALLAALESGRHVVANGSRGVIAALGTLLPHLVVVHVTAPAAVLASRIAARGRESGDEVLRRVARQAPPFPTGVACLTVSNDATLDAGIQRFTEALRTPVTTLRARRMPISATGEPVAWMPAADARGRPRVSLLGAMGANAGASMGAKAGADGGVLSVHVVDDDRLLAPGEIGLSDAAFARLGTAPGALIRVQAVPSPSSRAPFRRKLRGDALDEPAYEAILRDAIEGRYTHSELTAFLVAATQSLSDAEVLALARARTRFTPTIAWNEPIVVDKHSMGGVPGSRITLIVVPIVAAFGLAMPKTSSRAITSAAGTADAMETVARVDLTQDDVRRCVAQARACIAWNGRLNHSVVDDVMNAITRPLGLDSSRWAVASILSKKATAGATHVIVDLPYGPQTKLTTRDDADRLAALFESVGSGLGLHVRAFPTDGSGPIGYGVGPALEVRDVRQVLANDPDAPQDLRRKALFFAGQIIGFDPGVGSAQEGMRIAEAMLASGDASAAFDRIAAAQGARAEPVQPGAFTVEAVAQVGGVVAAIAGGRVADIGRAAGAPLRPGAGIDLLCTTGEHVARNQPLYRIHAETAADLQRALDVAGAMDAAVQIRPD